MDKEGKGVPGGRNSTETQRYEKSWHFFPDAKS